MRRHIVGILALVLLALGVGRIYANDHSDASAFLGNSGIRIGMVLAALWLAFPQVKRLAEFIERMPSWYFYTALSALFAAGVIRHVAAVLLLVPLLFLLWLLKPPPGARVIGGKQKPLEKEEPASPVK